MPISSQVSDMLPHYHDTLMLLKKYRDIAWIVEVSSRNLQNTAVPAGMFLTVLHLTRSMPALWIAPSLWDIARRCCTLLIPPLI